MGGYRLGFVRAPAGMAVVNRAWRSQVSTLPGFHPHASSRIGLRAPLAVQSVEHRLLLSRISKPHRRRGAKVFASKGANF